MILTARWVDTFFVALSAVVASFSEIWRKALIWCLRLKQFYLTSPCLLWPRDFLYQDCHAWCKPFVKIILTPSSIYPLSKPRPSHSNFFTILTIIHEQEQHVATSSPHYPPYSNCHHHLPSLFSRSINHQHDHKEIIIKTKVEERSAQTLRRYQAPGELWWFWTRKKNRKKWKALPKIKKVTRGGGGFEPDKRTGKNGKLCPR